jgi:hypothetical protein
MFDILVYKNIATGLWIIVYVKGCRGAPVLPEKYAKKGNIMRI